MKKILKTIEIYQTTDGKEFNNLNDAEKHQNWIDSKKLYIIVEITVSYDGYEDKKIFGCYADISIANTDLEKLEEQLDKGNYPIRYILETIVISEESLIK